MSKCFKDFDSLKFWKVVEERVWYDWYWVEVFSESNPSESFLGRGSWFHSISCGWFCSKEISQEVISFGDGQILKLFGAWCGTEVRMNFVSLKSDKWKYLEEASETSFCFPGNHWLYKQLSASITMEASFWAVIKGTISLENQQNLLDVLSVWVRIHDSSRRPSVK